MNMAWSVSACGNDQKILSREQRGINDDEFITSDNHEAKGHVLSTIPLIINKMTPICFFFLFSFGDATDGGR